MILLIILLLLRHIEYVQAHLPKPMEYQMIFFQTLRKTITYKCRMWVVNIGKNKWHANSSCHLCNCIVCQWQILPWIQYTI